jgi:hypothetical protein
MRRADNGVGHFGHLRSLICFSIDGLKRGGGPHHSSSSSLSSHGDAASDISSAAIRYLPCAIESLGAPIMRCEFDEVVMSRQLLRAII